MCIEKNIPFKMKFSKIEQRDDQIIIDANESTFEQNIEIAEKLSLATTTVISHRKNIMEKIHARSLADVIIYCVVKGIVSIEEL